MGDAKSADVLLSFRNLLSAPRANSHSNELRAFFAFVDLRALGKRGAGLADEALALLDPGALELPPPPAAAAAAAASGVSVDAEAEVDLDILGTDPIRRNDELLLGLEPESPRCLILARLLVRDR